MTGAWRVDRPGIAPEFYDTKAEADEAIIGLREAVVWLDTFDYDKHNQGAA